LVKADKVGAVAKGDGGARKEKSEEKGGGNEEKGLVFAEAREEKGKGISVVGGIY